MNTRDGAPATLQGRGPQEAASGAKAKIGGTSHAIGCRSLMLLVAVHFDWRHDHIAKIAVLDELRKQFIRHQDGGNFSDSL